MIDLLITALTLTAFFALLGWMHGQERRRQC